MTTENPYPISLNEVMFVRSIVVAVPEHSPNPERISLPPINEVNVTKVEGEAGVYAASMRTVINPEMDKASPYHVDMECVAQFTANDTLSAEDAMRGITINAHSVMYGAIREAVAWITARQPYGQLLLGLSVLKTSAPQQNKQ